MSIRMTRPATTTAGTGLRARPSWLPALAASLCLAGCGSDDGAPPASPVSPAPAGVTIGGRITGVAAGSRIVLSNGTEQLTLVGDGAFAFATPLPAGQAFVVAIASLPATQSCIALQAAGTVGSAPVDQVRVVCGPAERKAFTATAGMVAPRRDHQMVTTRSGIVFAFGGYDPAGNAATDALRIERYDPALDRWTVAGTLPFRGVVSNGFELVSGKILLIVQRTGNATVIYDPVDGSVVDGPAFRILNGPNGNVDTGYYAKTLALGDGRIFASDGILTEIYDPALGAWSPARSPPSSHLVGNFVLLSDGTVLAIGGLTPPVDLPQYPNGNADSDVFDPRTGTWTPAGKLNLPRFGAQAITLVDGRVLLLAGSTGSIVRCGCGTSPVSSAELYDPRTRSWTVTGPFAGAREGYSLTLMTTGRVVAVGGNVPSVAVALFGPHTFPTPLASAESFDPATDAWSSWASLAEARTHHAAVLLRDGRLLVTGGSIAVAGSPPNPSVLQDWTDRVVATSGIGY